MDCRDGMEGRNGERKPPLSHNHLLFRSRILSIVDVISGVDRTSKLEPNVITQIPRVEPSSCRKQAISPTTPPRRGKSATLNVL